MNARSDDIDLGDITVHIDEWGSGEPLVLLHGYTGAGVDFVDVAPRLADGRRVITITQRGHGASSNTGDAASYTFSQLADDLTRALDRLGLDVIDLLGHSMGGIVSMLFVLAHPERVRSLILMDTAAAPASNIPPDFLETVSAVAVERGMAAMWEQVGEVWSSAAQSEEMRERLRDKILSMDPLAFRELGRQLFDYPSMLDALAGVDCPTTIIVGANDTGLRQGADDLAAIIPGAELVVIPDAGHSPQDDQPELWIAAVQAHLDRTKMSARGMA